MNCHTMGLYVCVDKKVQHLNEVFLNSSVIEITVLK